MPRGYDTPLFKSDGISAVDPRAAEIVAAICPGRPGRLPDVRETFHCQIPCPSYTGLPVLNWDLTMVVFGHFLASGSEDAAVSTMGCEPHSNNWGGTILLTHRSGRWRLIWYKGWTITQNCHVTAPRTGRQVLLCEITDV